MARRGDAAEGGPALPPPDEREIARLPFCARVAFAARCARRVLPLLRYERPGAPAGYAAAVGRAVEVAERAAAGLAVRSSPAPPPAAVGPACRHCSRPKVNCPRGLCRSCYYTPGVKELYPPTTKSARHGADNFTGGAPLPAPTAAAPGTPEKLAVLEWRAALRQALFHPADARHAGDPRPLAFVAATGLTPTDPAAATADGFAVAPADAVAALAAQSVRHATFATQCQDAMAAFAAHGRTTVALAQRAMCADYDALLRAAGAEQWTDTTPVPPEFFGPLWPGGPPPGWPTGPGGAEDLVPEIHFPPGASDVVPASVV